MPASEYDVMSRYKLRQEAPQELFSAVVGVLNVQAARRRALPPGKPSRVVIYTAPAELVLV